MNQIHGTDVLLECIQGLPGQQSQPMGSSWLAEHQGKSSAQAGCCRLNCLGSNSSPLLIMIFPIAVASPITRLSARRYRDFIAHSRPAAEDPLGKKAQLGASCLIGSSTLLFSGSLSPIARVISHLALHPHLAREAGHHDLGDLPETSAG